MAKNQAGKWQDVSNITIYTFSIRPNYLIAYDGQKNDKFGSSVSLSSDGETLVVGASDDNNKNGSVYIYKWNGNTWAVTKLIASDGSNEAYFGNSVSVSAYGNTLVVGALGDNNFTGSVYVFRWNGSTWTETKLTASDGGDLDIFGDSVSVSADSNTLVVGAPGDNNNYNDSGSVYVFRWNGSTWAETKLTASDGGKLDIFGDSVSVSADSNTLVVGASGDNNNYNDSGSVYVFRWNGNTWAETKLTASDGQEEAYFGHSVSISSDGKTLVVGAYHDIYSKGSAYIYNWNGSTWAETKLTASDSQEEAYFGHSVSISSDGKTLVIGAYHDIYSNGSAYIYNWNGNNWSEKKLTALYSEAGDFFGGSVSMSSDGETFAVGASGNNTEKGSVYLFYR